MGPRLAAACALTLASCKPPSQSPPPVEVGRPPPISITEPRPRDNEEGDSWEATPVWDGGAGRVVAPLECPSGSIFKGGKCVGEVVCPGGSTWDGAACRYRTTDPKTDVSCPRGTTRVGSKCLGEVVCPSGSAWDGSACRALAAPASPSSSALPAGACTLRINSIPATMVIVDGRVVGPTPRMQAIVSAGTHSVVFVHETLGKKSVSVKCAVGEVKVVAVKLTDGPQPADPAD